MGASTSDLSNNERAILNYRKYLRKYRLNDLVKKAWNKLNNEDKKALNNKEMIISLKNGAVQNVNEHIFSTYSQLLSQSPSPSPSQSPSPSLSLSLSPTFGKSRKKRRSIKRSS